MMICTRLRTRRVRRMVRLAVVQTVLLRFAQQRSCTPRPLVSHKSFVDPSYKNCPTPEYTEMVFDDYFCHDCSSEALPCTLPGNPTRACYIPHVGSAGSPGYAPPPSPPCPRPLNPYMHAVLCHRFGNHSDEHTPRRDRPPESTVMTWGPRVA